MNKFKKWIIKSLGGYTEMTIPQEPKYIEKSLRIETYKASMDVPWHTELPTNVVIRNLQEKMAEELTKHVDVHEEKTSEGKRYWIQVKVLEE